MYYAIEVLEKERQLIKDCLSTWEKEKYPEARQQREIKLKELEKGIETLKRLNRF